MVLLDIEEREAYSNIALNNRLKDTAPENQGFVRELVYGVLRYKKLLDHYIDRLAAKGIKSIKKRDLNVLRLGLYQIIYMNSVPDYAAISESVDLARKFCKGREKLVNAVLRSFLRKRDELAPERPDDSAYSDSAYNEMISFLAIKYSYDESIVRLWLKQYGLKQTEKMLNAGNEIPDLTIRVNELKTGIEELECLLKQQGFKVSKGEMCRNILHVTGSGLLNSRSYRDGLFSVQDESAMRAVEILDPQPGDTLIDMCAAPGGKCLAAAEKMKNTGHIKAFDVYQKKTEVIRHEALRLGIDIVEADVADGTEMDHSLKNSADRVIADVPCSGLGVVRRKPEIKYRSLNKEYNEEHTELCDLTNLQLSILRNASEYVKPGGVLVYSTCTVNRDENDAVIDRFMKCNKGFSKEKEIQIFPGENGADGFFICRLKAENDDSDRI